MFLLYLCFLFYYILLGNAYILLFHCKGFLSSTFLISSIVLHSAVFSIFVCSSFLTFSIDSTNYYCVFCGCETFLTSPCDIYLLLIHNIYLVFDMCLFRFPSHCCCLFVLYAPPFFSLGLTELDTLMYMINCLFQFFSVTSILYVFSYSPCWFFPFFFLFFSLVYPLPNLLCSNSNHESVLKLDKCLFNLFVIAAAVSV